MPGHVAINGAGRAPGPKKGADAMLESKEVTEFTKTVKILHDEHRLFGTKPEIALVRWGGVLRWEAKPSLEGQEDLRLEIEFEEIGYGLRGPFAVKQKDVADNPVRGVYLFKETNSVMTGEADVPADTYWKYRIILRDRAKNRILHTLDPGVAIKKKH